MKLMTWNVQWCCGLDGRVDVDRIVREARALADFDVLCLQEVAVNYPGLPGAPAHDQPALLGALLPGFQVFYGPAVEELGRRGEWQRFGNLIASRLPVLQVQQYSLPYPADAGKKSMPRACLCVTVMAPFGPLRVMTTHLEYYSRRQRLAQVRALREFHALACEQAAFAPLADETGWPFQSKLHTADAMVCGDWNFETHSEEYCLMQSPNEVPADPASASGQAGAFVASELVDAWTLAHPGQPHAPTFQLFDRCYRPEPITVDFIFVSAGLKSRVRRVEVELQTRASDHQPVLIELT